MGFFLKILLSIPSFLMLGYLVIFTFSYAIFYILASDMKSYYILINGLWALIIIQIIILVKKLWSLKFIAKSVKQEWTGIMIVFSSIGTLIFSWHKIDQLINVNNSKPDEI